MRTTLLLLAFIAGFVDTASFIGAGGVFSAHVTGNFVLFAAALVHGVTPADYLKLLTLPLFMVGVAGAAVVIHKLKLADGMLVQRLGLMQGGLILAAGALSFFSSQDFLIVALLVVAMALQNVLQKMAFAGSPTTTVMTGNMTTLALEAVGAQVSGTKSPKVASIFQIAVAFFIGCALAALLTQIFGIVSVLVPGLILVIYFHKER